jgi:hypothetical protein
MQTLVIPIAFLFLCCLFLWVIIGARGHWWLKLILMIAAVIISYQVWQSLDSYLGSAKPIELKAMSGKTAFLFWANVNEPDGGKDLGSISMWLRLTQEVSAKLYKFPYSRTLHETTQSFVDEILKNNGAPIQIAFTDDSGKEKQVEKGNGNSQAQAGGGQSGTNHRGFGSDGEPRVYILPPFKPPEKLAN